MISKSAQYLGLHGNLGLILLNEVALGKSNRINRDDSSLVKAPKGFDSVLATGTIMPDPKVDFEECVTQRHTIVLLFSANLFVALFFFAVKHCRTQVTL
jgi:poly [ADP-ribose] polymerase